jgi:carboxylate-amine ligase
MLGGVRDLSTLGAAPRGGSEGLGSFDEASEGGAPRPGYEALLAAIEDAGPAELAAEAEARSAAAGLSFKMNRFRLDPVPRLLSADEWAQIAAAAEQRSRALNSFVADAHGEREIVAAGVVPEYAIESAEHYEPAMRDVPTPPAAWAVVVGLDLVRDPAGEFCVLEDNTRSPSGISFAAAARGAIAPAGLPGTPSADPAEAFDLLGEALRAAAPPGAADPLVALFSEGPASGAFFEHDAIARRLGIPIVTAGDLAKSGGRLHARVGGVRREIDVLYRRVDGERLTKADGRPTALGRLLIEPLQQGGLTCVNAFGSGVADDKLIHAYVEEMIRFYLGEEPVLRSIPTYDLGDAEQRETALARLGELVVKPRGGLGGGGVVIGPLVGADELAAAAARIEAAPEQFIAQETVPLSTHPTVAGDALEPRHVDLRPYAIAIGDRIEVPRCALTRFAPDRGEMIVNSSRGGGAKDTWVIE